MAADPDYPGNIYVFACEDCGCIHEVNDKEPGFVEAFDAWRDSLYDDELDSRAPLPVECKNCGSKNIERHPELEEKGNSCNGFTRPDGAGLIHRGLKQAAEDTRKIVSGEDGGAFLRNLVGTGERKADAGIKYMKDVKKGAVKRRES